MVSVTLLCSDAWQKADGKPSEERGKKGYDKSGLENRNNVNYKCLKVET